MPNIPDHITKAFLRENPNVIFVFGDNTIRKGKGGAARLRDEPNTYGFITKKYPNNQDSSFYRPEEYKKIFHREMMKLLDFMSENTDKIFIITKLGGGLANRYHIYEQVIRPGLKLLSRLDNVVLQINYNW